MSAKTHHFTRSMFDDFATRMTFGEAVNQAEQIKRHDMLFGRAGECEPTKAEDLFLSPEQLAEAYRLRKIAARKAHQAAKAARRKAEGKPYGQGAYTRVILATEREPVETPSKWTTVGKPKPHGNRPKGYVCKTWTGL